MPLEPDLHDIPRGYTQGEGNNGMMYILPQYLMPDLQHGFAAYKKKIELGVEDANPRYDQSPDFETDTVGGYVQFPPLPILSDRERLAAHAEILALQKQLGISYKDASHRLYMAELERLKAFDFQCKAFTHASQCLKTSLQDINNTSASDGNETREGE